MAATDVHVQQYRGTTEQHQKYTGPVGELTVDTTKGVVVVQTGTAGGNPMAPENRKIKAGMTGLTVNGATEATLAQDITLNLVPANFVDTANSILFMNDGKISSKITMNYNEGTGKLTLIGSDDSSEVASVTIPAHTSGLQSATIVDQDGSGGSGTFLKLTFRLTTGVTQDVYADVSKLVDIYTAGSGVSVNASDRKISVKLATDSGLAFDAQGALKVDLTGTGSGSTGGAGIAGGLISSDDTDGDNELKTGEDGKLYVEPYTAGNGLALNDHQFAVVPAANKGLSVSASGVAVELAENGGLTFSGGKLKVDFSGGTGGDGSIAGGLVSPELPDDGEGENDLKVDEDGKLYVEPYTAGDGLALSDKEFSVALEASGNQIQLKNGKLWVPTDYGTMD